MCRKYPSVKTSSGEIIIGLPRERATGSGQLNCYLLIILDIVVVVVEGIYEPYVFSHSVP